MLRSAAEVADLAALPAELAARVPLAQHRAAAKTAAAQPNSAASKLLRAAQDAPTRRQRVVWLQRWGEAALQPLADVAACQAGCAHCCALPAAITFTEAEILGRAVARRPEKPARAFAVADLLGAGLGDVHARYERQFAHHVGTPCPFLQNQRCTVYAHRPFVCRTHLSLDDDDLLCRLVPGTPVPVFYANTLEHWALFLMAQPGEQVTDIRDFFPVATPS